MAEGALLNFLSYLTREEARVQADRLAIVWELQLESVGLEAQVARFGSTDVDDLSADLAEMKRWFDPIATGRRLRELISRLGPSPFEPDAQEGVLFASAGYGRLLLTPEGRVARWWLARALSNPAESRVSITPVDERVGLVQLVDTYRSWNQQRLNSVAGLLERDTATLRPTAAGLLFVMLVNRNTSEDRALPISKLHPERTREVSRAVSGPALAFAHGLTGKEDASSQGIDLYRGWALGELSRRLGTGLHQTDNAVWIDSERELSARARLAESIAGRNAAFRARVGTAVRDSLAAYDYARPALVALKASYERPSNTRELARQLISASTADFGRSDHDD